MELVKRIAIAEACGYVNPRWHGDDLYSDAGHIPDYLHDLNACHEMEETLTPLEEDRYADELEGITVARAWNATAKDRCEAFLRVKGLWKE